MAMHYYYCRLLLNNGATRGELVKLGFGNIVSARLYLEQRRDAVVLRLVSLPAWLNVALDAWRSFLHGRIQRADLAEFFRGLSVMLRGGVPIAEALEEFAREDHHPGISAMAADIRDNLLEGKEFSRSLEAHADVIPETVLNLARIGEASGTLDVTMTRAAEHLARVVRLGKDSKRAMIYPALVLVAVMGAAVFWLYYVVPSVTDMFRQMGVALPWITRVVVHAANAARMHFSIAAMVVISLTIAFWLLATRNARVRAMVHRLGYHAPISRTLVRSASLAFITEYLSLMLSSGVDVLQSLEVLERATRHEVYRQAIARARESVLQGESLSVALRGTGLFPGFMIRMVSIGEQTGAIDEQLAFLADEFRHRFEHVVATLGDVIQPAVMALVGGLFILVVASLFLPIYQIIGNVGLMR